MKDGDKLKMILLAWNYHNQATQGKTSKHNPLESFFIFIIYLFICFVGYVFFSFCYLIYFYFCHFVSFFVFIVFNCNWTETHTFQNTYLKQNTDILHFRAIQPWSAFLV